MKFFVVIITALILPALALGSVCEVPQSTTQPTVTVDLINPSTCRDVFPGAMDRLQRDLQEISGASYQSDGCGGLSSEDRKSLAVIDAFYNAVEGVIAENSTGPMTAEKQERVAAAQRQAAFEMDRHVARLSRAGRDTLAAKLKQRDAAQKLKVLSDYPELTRLLGNTSSAWEEALKARREQASVTGTIAHTWAALWDSDTSSDVAAKKVDEARSAMIFQLNLTVCELRLGHTCATQLDESGKPYIVDSFHEVNEDLLPPARKFKLEQLHGLRSNYLKSEKDMIELDNQALDGLINSIGVAQQAAAATSCASFMVVGTTLGFVTGGAALTIAAGAVGGGFSGAGVASCKAAIVSASRVMAEPDTANSFCTWGRNTSNMNNLTTEMVHGGLMGMAMGAGFGTIGQGVAAGARAITAVANVASTAGRVATVTGGLGTHVFGVGMGAYGLYGNYAQYNQFAEQYAALEAQLAQAANGPSCDAYQRIWAQMAEVEGRMGGEIADAAFNATLLVGGTTLGAIHSGRQIGAANRYVNTRNNLAHITDPPVRAHLETLRQRIDSPDASFRSRYENRQQLIDQYSATYDAHAQGTRARVDAATARANYTEAHARSQSEASSPELRAESRRQEVKALRELRKAERVVRAADEQLAAITGQGKAQQNAPARRLSEIDNRVAEIDRRLAEPFGATKVRERLTAEKTALQKERPKVFERAVEVDSAVARADRNIDQQNRTATAEQQRVQAEAEARRISEIAEVQERYASADSAFQHAQADLRAGQKNKNLTFREKNALQTRVNEAKNRRSVAERELASAAGALAPDRSVATRTPASVDSPVPAAPEAATPRSAYTESLRVLTANERPTINPDRSYSVPVSSIRNSSPIPEAYVRTADGSPGVISGMHYDASGRLQAVDVVANGTTKRVSADEIRPDPEMTSYRDGVLAEAQRFAQQERQRATREGRPNDPVARRAEAEFQRRSDEYNETRDISEARAEARAERVAQRESNTSTPEAAASRTPASAEPARPSTAEVREVAPAEALSSFQQAQRIINETTGPNARRQAAPSELDRVARATRDVNDVYSQVRSWGEPTVRDPAVRQQMSDLAQRAQSHTDRASQIRNSGHPESKAVRTNEFEAARAQARYLELARANGMDITPARSTGDNPLTSTNPRTAAEVLPDAPAPAREVNASRALAQFAQARRIIAAENTGPSPRQPSPAELDAIAAATRNVNDTYSEVSRRAETEVRDANTREQLSELQARAAQAQRRADTDRSEGNLHSARMGDFAAADARARYLDIARRNGVDLASPAPRARAPAGQTDLAGARRPQAELPNGTARPVPPVLGRPTFEGLASTAATKPTAKRAPASPPARSQSEQLRVELEGVSQPSSKADYEAIGRTEGVRQQVQERIERGLKITDEEVRKSYSNEEETAMGPLRKSDQNRTADERVEARMDRRIELMGLRRENLSDFQVGLIEAAHRVPPATDPKTGKVLIDPTTGQPFYNRDAIKKKFEILQTPDPKTGKIVFTEKQRLALLEGFVAGERVAVVQEGSQGLGAPPVAPRRTPAEYHAELTRTAGQRRAAMDFEVHRLTQSGELVPRNGDPNTLVFAPGSRGLEVQVSGPRGPVSAQLRGLFMRGSTRMARLQIAGHAQPVDLPLAQLHAPLDSPAQLRFAENVGNTVVDRTKAFREYFKEATARNKTVEDENIIFFKSRTDDPRSFVQENNTYLSGRVVGERFKVGQAATAERMIVVDFPNPNGGKPIRRDVAVKDLKVDPVHHRAKDTALADSQATNPEMLRASDGDSAPSPQRVPASTSGRQPPRPGSNRYAVVQELGKGGQGRVVVAQDANGNVAIVKESTQYNELRNEANHLKAMQGNSRFSEIVKQATGKDNLMRTIADEDGVSSLATRSHGDVEPMSKHTTPETRLPREEVASRLADAALGLADLHDKGITHGDVKPANLLWAKDGQAKIIDLGSARNRQQIADHIRDTAGQVGIPDGTHPYMSPDYMNNDPNSHGTTRDIYAMGVTLFEMTTGKLPYKFDPKVMMDYAVHVAGENRPQFPADVPPGLQKIISKAMDNVPERRYQSMREMAADLRRFAVEQRIRRATDGRQNVLTELTNKKGNSLRIMMEMKNRTLTDKQIDAIERARLIPEVGDWVAKKMKILSEVDFRTDAKGRPLGENADVRLAIIEGGAAK